MDSLCTEGGSRWAEFREQLAGSGLKYVEAKESNAVGEGQMCPSHPHEADSDVIGFTSAS